MVYRFPEPLEASRKPTGKCPGCGYRREETKHVKIWDRWICDLVQLENGHWIHSNRAIEAELAGHKIVGRLIEDAL